MTKRIFLLFLGVLFLGVNAGVTQLIKKATSKRRDLEDVRLGYVMEILNNFSSLKLFEAIQERVDLARRNQVQINRADIRLNQLKNISSLVGGIFFNGGFHIVVIIVGVLELSAGNMTFGELLLVLQMVGGLVFLFSSIVSYLAGFQKTMIAVKNLNREVLSMEQAVEHRAMKLRAVERIVFENVSFGYNAEKNVLEDKSFDIEFPNHVRIKGGNGSGKSTVLKLILGILSPSQGRIELNGRDIKVYDKRDISEIIAYVPQVPLFFEDSVLNNVTLKRVIITPGDLIEILHMLRLDRITKSFEEKGDFLVEESGRNLSSGEKMRLAIARALVMKPQIILLDEMEANLDEKTLNSIVGRIKEKYNLNFVRVSHDTRDVYTHDEIILTM